MVLDPECHPGESNAQTVPNQRFLPPLNPLGEEDEPFCPPTFTEADAPIPSSSYPPISMLGPRDAVLDEVQSVDSQLGHGCESLASLRALYTEKEAKRGIVFRDAVRTLELQFRDGLLQRSRAVRLREEDLRLNLTTFDTRFSSFQMFIGKRFQYEEFMRNELENPWRDRSINDQNNHESRFARELSWFVTLMETSMRKEQNVHTSLKAEASHLLCTMVQILRDTQRRRKEVLQFCSLMGHFDWKVRFRVELATIVTVQEC